MKVLMISGNDTIETEEARGEFSQFRRLLDDICKELTEVHVIARAATKEAHDWNQGNLFVYPIPLSRRFTRPWHVIRVGHSILKRTKVDLITSQDIWGMGVAAYVLKKRFRKPILLELHGDYLDSEWYANKGAEYRVANWIGKWLLGKGDLVRATSEDIKEKLLAVGIPESRIYYLPHRTDIHEFRPGIDTSLLKRDLNLNQETVLLSVGRLYVEKNLMAMIDAACLLVGQIAFKLIIIGDGPEASKLREYALKKGVAPHILFLGAKPHSELPLYYNLGDVFLLSSVTEGRPNTIQEALACGVPVVATKVSGVAELVEDGETGFRVDINDPLGMSKAIVRIVSDEGLRQTMRIKCRERMERDFTWERGVSGMIEMYKLAAGI